MTVRTRFSPSPTGMIHLGNARAALFAALFAAKNRGVFILRIEDTDASRSEEKYAQSLQDDLHWLSIDWQEGPGKDGPFGPYWQSQRQAVYQKYYQILEQNGQIYPCFCSDQELLLARKTQLARGQAPRYAKTCYKLSKEEIERRLATQQRPAWRFSVPDNEILTFTDIVKGLQQFNSSDIGDFIVRRADGTAPFLFCNAIDDAVMQVTHVLRGEDHVANTPRQILLLKTLGLSIPQYGHLSLIMGDDGAPLSKRHGSFSVEGMRQQGYLTLALINYLARLGHVIDNNELFSFEKLVPYFYLEKLSRSPARFDLSQLKYWQKAAVQGLTAEDFWRWLGEDITAQIPQTKQALFAEVVKSNIEFPHDALIWGKIFFHENAEIAEEQIPILREAGEQYFVEAEQAVQKYGTDLGQVLADMKVSLKITGKKLFMPLRIALTGKVHGPELAHIAQILGPKKIYHRLGHAFKLISKKQVL